MPIIQVKLMLLAVPAHYMPFAKIAILHQSAVGL